MGDVKFNPGDFFTGVPKIAIRSREDLLRDVIDVYNTSYASLGFIDNRTLHHCVVSITDIGVWIHKCAEDEYQEGVFVPMHRLTGIKLL